MSYGLYNFGEVVHRNRVEPSSYEVVRGNSGNAEHVCGVCVSAVKATGRFKSCAFSKH